MIIRHFLFQRYFHTASRFFQLSQSLSKNFSHLCQQNLRFEGFWSTSTFLDRRRLLWRKCINRFGIWTSKTVFVFIYRALCHQKSLLELSKKWTTASVAWIGNRTLRSLCAASHDLVGYKWKVLSFQHFAYYPNKFQSIYKKDR